MTEKTRGNLTADAGLPPPAIPFDVLGGLGYFGPTWVVPLNTSLFYRLYPLGWTSGGWFETSGRNIGWSANGLGCHCFDCTGDNPNNEFIQQFPDDLIPCNMADVDEPYDHSTFPGIMLKEGCQLYTDDRFNCTGTEGSAHYICNADPDVGQRIDAGWPKTSFDFLNHSSRIRLVTDTSGPEVEWCDSDTAMEIDFSGAGDEGAAFVGQGGGQDDVPLPDPDETQVRSQTGWTVDPGSQWRFLFAVKAVPDNDGFVCTGYEIFVKFGFWPGFDSPHSTLAVGADMNHSPIDEGLTLNGDWQAFDLSLQYDGLDPILNSPFGILTLNVASVDCSASYPGVDLHRRKGRVHVKCVSIMPLEIGPITVKKRLRMVTGVIVP